MTLRILNTTRSAVLCTAAVVARTREERLRGLIGSQPLQPGEGMFFPRCSSIHTVEMSFPIDVLFIDFREIVLKAVSNAQPGCHFNVLAPADLCCVLEMPAGMIEGTGTRKGDAISIMPATHSPASDLDEISAFWGKA